MVQEVGEDGEQRRFLPAMLRRGGGERGPDLADQRPPHPKLPGLIEEIGHLAGHTSEPGGRADDDGVVAGQFVRRRANAGIIDPAGDFRAAYVGPKTGDLDVLAADATFNGSKFVLSGQFAAPVGTTSTGVYIFGLDRGAGTAVFGADAPGVLSG